MASAEISGVVAHLEELGTWNQTAWEAAEDAARTPPPAASEPGKLPAAVHADRWLELADASDDPDAGLGNALPRAARERFRLLLRLLPEESEWPRVRAALEKSPLDDPDGSTPVRDALRLVFAVLADDAPATEAALARFPVGLEEHPERDVGPAPDAESFLAIPEDEVRERMDAATKAFREEMRAGGDDRFARWSCNPLSKWKPYAIGSWLERRQEESLDRNDLDLAERIEDRLARIPEWHRGGPFPGIASTAAWADFLERRILPGRDGTGMHDLPFWDSFARICADLREESRPRDVLDRLFRKTLSPAAQIRKKQIGALIERRMAAIDKRGFEEKSRAFAALADAKSAADGTGAFCGYDGFENAFLEWCSAAADEAAKDPAARKTVLAMRPLCRAALEGRILGPESFESDRHLALAYVGALEAAGALDEAERLLWDSIGRNPSDWGQDALVPLWSFYLRHGRARDVADFVEGCAGWAGKDPVGRDPFGVSQIDALILAAFHALGRTNATERIARHFGFDAGGRIGGVPDDADVVRILQDFALEREARAVAAAAGLPEPEPRPPWHWTPENLARWRADAKRDLARAAAAPPLPVPPIIPGTEPHDRYPCAVTKPAGLPPRFDGLFARRPVAAFERWWINWPGRAEERLEKLEKNGG